MSRIAKSVPQLSRPRAGGRDRADHARQRHDHHSDCRSSRSVTRGSPHAANHHEVTLVQLTFEFYMIEAKPENLIGDRAYISDQLDAEMRGQGTEMIAPQRSIRVRMKTQDGRRLRRYGRRWVVERFFDRLQWQWRLLIRLEYHRGKLCTGGCAGEDLCVQHERRCWQGRRTLLGRPFGAVSRAIPQCSGMLTDTSATLPTTVA